MNTFLQEVAQYIYKGGKAHLSDVHIIFPSRRAAVFFSKYLSEIIETPIWSPRYVTISDLMFEISGYSKADQVELLFTLFEVFRVKVNPHETFDDFYALGEVLVNDFDDVDKHLVNAEDLFSNLSSLKNIEDHFEYLSSEQKNDIRSFWVHFDAPSTDQDTFTNLWEALAPLYLNFKEKLDVSGRVYEGMANRAVAEKIRSGWKPGNPDEKYFVVGFNGFTPSEEVLMESLKREGRAEFFWDYDPTYVYEDTVHEAGYFLRKNLKRFPPPSDFVKPSPRITEARAMEVISAPNDPGQVKMMSWTLEDLKRQKRVEKNNTAVVLSDEHLLSQVMHSIPDGYTDINITMGYPLIHTPAFSLVQNLVDLQMRKKESNGSVQFYFKDVIRILEHQYISNRQDAALEALTGQIKSGNRIFPNQQFLDVNDVTRTLFIPVSTASGMIDYLREILLAVLPGDEDQEGSVPDRKNLQKEYIYHLYLTINRLGDLVMKGIQDFGLDVFLRLLRKMLHGVTIPFLGEPLRGLQVMGILETRVLDFENLIILSMNEGIFPRTAPGFTVIPFNLRKGFGLPTPEHQDRLYAYYFYRLLHRARKITFIYNSRTDGMRSGEMSRFLYQLKYLYGMTMVFKSLGMSIRQLPDRPIEIKKGKDETDLLYAFCKPGDAVLTPSALNAYLDCSLRFYFRYLSNIREPQKISEEIDQMVFGNLLHYSMEKLYCQAPQNSITPQFLEGLISDGSQLQKALDSALTKTWPGEGDGSVSSGRFLIIKEILLRYLNQILEEDRKAAPFKILGLEERIGLSFTISPHNEKHRVNLGGIMDRIDRIGDTIRIIDYKTGGVTKNIKSIHELFIRNNPKRSREAFQTFIYAWMYIAKHGQHLVVKPGLYDVRQMHTEHFTPDFTLAKQPVINLKSFFGEIEEGLLDLLNEIFNPSIPFTRADDTKLCEWCIYQRLCKRD